MVMHEWSFDKPKGYLVGWNNAPTAIFKDKPLRNLTREVIQNSLDARMGDESVVRVEFKKHRVKRDKIPGMDSLREAIEYCCEEVMGSLKPEDTAWKEINRARKIAESDEISVLSISDYGTTGMSGREWERYLKIEGDPSGSSERAGSHGLGKAAPVCMSDLRTIVVSTYWENDDGKGESLIQGRTILAAHKRNGESFGHVGFLGDEFAAIPGDRCPQGWIIRPPRVGTTIHVLGWSGVGDGWKDCILGYAAMNFFPAFVRGRLEVLVAEEGSIDRSLDSADLQKNVFSIGRIRKAVEKEDSEDEFDSAEYFHRCLSDPGRIEEEVRVPGLGRCLLRILVTEGAPKKVALIRENMFITDDIPNVRKRYSESFRDFAVVVECQSKEGKKMLRDMEPPEHNAIQPDRISDMAGRGKAKKALRDLANEIRSLIEKHTTDPVKSGGVIEHLAKHLAIDAEDDDAIDDENEIDPEGRVVLNAIPYRPPRSSQETGDDESEDEGEGGEGGESGGVRGGGGEGGTKTPGPNPDDVPGPSLPSMRERVVIRDIRVVTTGPRLLQVYATVDEGAKVNLSIREVGADREDDLLVKELNGVSVDVEGYDGGGVSVRFAKSDRVRMEVTVNRDIVGGTKIIQKVPAG